MSWRRRRVERVEEAPPPRKGPLVWPWLVLLLLLVAGGLALAYFLTRDDDDGSKDTVPEVVGLQEPVAVDRLRQEGYPADVRRVVERPSEAGRVVRQQPAGGAELDPGGTVVLIVARRPNTVDVPKVVGLRGAAACERLQAERLRCDASQVFARRARGLVIRQVPPPNAEAPRGSAVRIQISKGPRLVTVPLLIGQTEAQATAQIRRLGFRPNVVRVASAEVSGRVVAQRPQPNTKAAKGSIVRINVSRGPGTTTGTTTTGTTTTAAQATVPNVIGQNEATAEQTVRSAGFRVQKRAQPVTDPTQDGIVQRQSPPPNRRVRAGSLVIIFVGRLTSD